MDLCQFLPKITAHKNIPAYYRKLQDNHVFGDIQQHGQSRVEKQSQTKRLMKKKNNKTRVEDKNYRI